VLVGQTTGQGQARSEPEHGTLGVLEHAAPAPYLLDSDLGYRRLITYTLATDAASAPDREQAALRCGVMPMQSIDEGARLPQRHGTEL
jgi:hypothetical protein